MPNTVARDSIKRSTAVNLLLGLWLFAFAAYGNMTSPETWSIGVAGGLIALFAAIRFGRPLHGRTFSALNMLLGAWVIVSPWIFGFADDSIWLVNSLAAGIAVFAFGCYGATSIARRTDDEMQASA